MTGSKTPLSAALQRLAQLKTRKQQTQQTPRLDPALEMFAQGGIDIYQRKNEE